MKKLFMMLILASVPSIARAQLKSSKICVWAESEDPGVLMPTQVGGSVNSISESEVSFIQQMIVTGLRADKTNNIVDPCPQTGENIELDVIIGQFLGGYVHTFWARCCRSQQRTTANDYSHAAGKQIWRAR